MGGRVNDRLSRVAALRPAVRRAANTDRPGAGFRPPESSAIPRLRDGPYIPEADRLVELLGAFCQRNRYGEHLVVRQWFSEPQECPVSPYSLRLLVPDAAEKLANPQQWLFLDTETTGLAGGTGTYAFLVGVAWWDAGGLQVEQFFMRDHTEEHSLLLELTQRLAERPILVTFNGKSFDWPLLETRYRMTRSITPCAPQAHLDLLHPARQLWRLRLGSVRLTELERHVLAWDRGWDIPSELIPQIYFDFLRGGSQASEAVLSVFRHNQMDLRGLAALAGRILSLLEEPEAAEGDALELYGLSRLLRRRGELFRARRVYERALGAGLPAAVDRAARRELAALAKREHDFARATSLWEDLLGESADALEAYEQLAIYYEHHAREPHRAAELAREALAQLRGSFRAGLIDRGRYAKLCGRFQHRLARLERHSRRAYRPLLGPA